MAFCCALDSVGRRVGLVGAVVVACCGAARGQWTATVLEAPGSVALGVGTQNIGGYTGPANLARAQIWSSDGSGIISLHPAGASLSMVRSVSGSWQGGYVQFGSTKHASIWNGSAASRIDLSPPGLNQDTLVLGMCDDRQVGIRQITGGSSMWALLWNGTPESAVELTPAGATNSSALATDGLQQVGWVKYVGEQAMPVLWTGTAASVVNLLPLGSLGGFAAAVGNGQQGGGVNVNDTGRLRPHAAIWSGSADSIVMLHPAAMLESQVNGVHAGRQVGTITSRAGQVTHAAIWEGSESSMVDLHQFVPASWGSSVATSIWSDAKFIRVVGYVGTNGTLRAVLWTRPIAGPCIADLTGDGEVDLSDFNEFLGCFDVGAACADIDSQPGVDLGDFFTFFAAFDAGC